MHQNIALYFRIASIKHLISLRVIYYKVTSSFFVGSLRANSLDKIQIYTDTRKYIIDHIIPLLFFITDIVICTITILQNGKNYYNTLYSF